MEELPRAPFRGGSSPLAEKRTASAPPSSSGPCPPTPSGNASLINCAAMPLPAGTRPNSWPSEAAAVRSRATPARGAPFDQAMSGGVLGPGAARLETTSTASTRSRSGSFASSRWIPSSPSVEPSTDASTIVFRDGVPWSARPTLMSAAVSAALVVASGTDPASRAATTTIWRRVAPARLPVTLRRRWPSSPPKGSTTVVKPLREKEWATRRATDRSPSVPGRLSGRSEAICSALAAAARPWKRTSAASACGSAAGRSSSENATTIRANSAGRNAARYRRGSITVRASPPVEPTISWGRRSVGPQRHVATARPHPPGRRRAVGPEAAGVSASQGGLRGGARDEWRGGARALPRPELRPRGARRDAAEARRLRRLPPDPRPIERPDHHAHRQGRGVRQGARPRARRRRLHHQAVLDARVPQPREGGPQALRPCPRRAPRRGSARGGRAAHRLRQAHRRDPGQARTAHVRRVRDPLDPRSQPGSGVQQNHDPGPALGRLVLPRPAHDRRPHPPPAREAGARSQGAGVPVHRAGRGLPLQRQMRLPLPPARSLGNKLALVFFAVIAFAFSVIFFIVVPQLQTNLEHQRVNELRRVVPAFTPTLEGLMGSNVNARPLDELVRSIADSSDAKVTVFGVVRSKGSPPALWSYANSRVSPQVDASRALAYRAYYTRHIESDVESVNGHRTAQAAVPLHTAGRAPKWTVVYTRDLGDVQDAVSLIRTRMLAAGGIALLIAMIGGYLVARAMARRVRRLELAAKEVAAGRFIEPP